MSDLPPEPPSTQRAAISLFGIANALDELLQEFEGNAWMVAQKEGRDAELQAALRHFERAVRHMRERVGRRLGGGDE